MKTKSLIGNAPTPGALEAAMARHAEGDDAAFGEVYEHLAPHLHRFLVRYVDRACADDIVQQTMLRIHRARGRYVEGARVVPWALTIARRLLVDQWRRERLETHHAAMDRLAASDSPPDERASAAELVRYLATETLRELPAAQRVAFALVKEEGMTAAHAALALGTTTMAVKLRVHRACGALREALVALEIPSPNLRTAA